MYFPVARAGLGPQATFYFRSERVPLGPIPASPPLAATDPGELLLRPVSAFSLSEPSAIAAPSFDAIPGASPRGSDEPAVENADSITAVDVRRSWAAVKNHTEVIGRDFFERLFKARPDLLRLFGFRDDLTYLDCRGLRVHSTAVVRTVGRLLDGLHGLPALAPELRRLGRSHAAMGVPPSAFPTMRDCLMGALADHLGPAQWTAAASAAWLRAFDAVSSDIVHNYETS